MKDTQPKIVCDNICKTFIQKGTQVVPVLENISLEVRDQEFLVILGPGQCGKTTLLRILAGLESPSSGAAYLDGKQIVAPGPQIGLELPDVPVPGGGIGRHGFFGYCQ